MNWLTRVLRTGTASALPADPDGPEEWLRAGYDCESRGDFAGAERYYRRVLDRDPAHADALYFLGRLSVLDRRIPAEPGAAASEGAETMFRKLRELLEQLSQSLVTG